MRPQVFDNGGQDGQHPVDLLGGIVPAQREAHAAAGRIGRKAHGGQHVAGLQAAAGAGGTAGTGDAGQVQPHEQTFALHPGEGKIRISGKAENRMAVQPCVRHGGQYSVNQPVAKRGNMGRVFGQLGGGQRKGLAHAHNAGHVFRSCPKPPFLCAAPTPLGP